jgi:hypothetical protein
MQIPQEWIRAPKTSRQRVRAGWTRLSPRGALTCLGEFRHDATGTRVAHCGHPTALWPYLVTTADGRSYVAPNSRGFVHLATAMQAVEAGIEQHGRRVLFAANGRPMVL